MAPGIIPGQQEDGEHAQGSGARANSQQPPEQPQQRRQQRPRQKRDVGWVRRGLVIGPEETPSKHSQPRRRMPKSGALSAAAAAAAEAAASSSHVVDYQLDKLECSVWSTIAGHGACMG